MNKLKNISYDRLVQFAMVAVAIFLVSLLYPSSVKFKYEFKKGQEWRYENLYAPFDFPILKTEEEIAKGKTELENSITPFYKINKQLKTAKLQDCEAAIKQWESGQLQAGDSINAENNAEKYLYFFSRLISSLMEQGVIELDGSHKEASGNFVLNIMDANTRFKRTLASYITIENARQIVQDSLNNTSLQIPPNLQQVLLNSITANIIYEKGRTEEIKEMMMSGFVTTKGLVQQGDLIVQRGNLITNEIYERLFSFKEKYASDISSLRSSGMVYLGYLIITILIFVALMMYINSYIKDLILKWQHLGFILFWILIFSYLTFILEKNQVFNSYLIPYCIVPIVISHFFNFRLAFFAHVIVVLIAGFLSSLGFSFIFMQIVAGVVAVLAVADARDWSKFFISVLAILLAYVLSYFGISLIEEGSLVSMDWDIYSLLVFNGFLTLMAFPFIPLAEKIFGFTTSISLVELSDMNRPLLREMTIKAPGTLQHSVQVGNLSEAAAREIGADELLVRVAALYHDIGKMENPQYFIENQSNNNLHDEISAKESAKIIIGHITKGEKLARKNKLPKSIIRFITTHHGTSKVEYFYKTFLQNNPGITINAADFTYPGPKPVSKEEGILMMADTLEAASRSLKEPTDKEIDQLVEKLVAAKIANGQLDECELTYGDVAKCKAVFKKNLKSMLHVRIEYPE